MIYFIAGVIALNIFLSLAYSLGMKLRKQSNVIPKLIIMLEIPLFGIMIFFIMDFASKGKGFNINEMAFDDESKKSSDCGISNPSNSTAVETLPFYDILGIRDAIRRRSLIFKSVDGQYKEMYPLLQKVLQDTDGEVVHYASSVITDYMKKINENYMAAKARFAANANDGGHCRKYADAYLDLICWQELNGVNTFKERQNISQLFDVIFSHNTPIEEKYFMEKISNEILLEDYCNAFETCKRFLCDYPESEKPLMSLLELWYSSKNFEMFAMTLNTTIGKGCKDLPLSRKSADIIDFWRKNIKFEEQDG